MSEAMMEQVEPERATIVADASESRLRDLYEHLPGTLRLGLIASADGKAAGPDGSSRSINGPQDVRILLTLRALADVVLVGARTARNERYGNIRLPQGLAATRTRTGQAALPHLAIATYTGELPPALAPERTWIVTTAGSPATRLAEGPWRDRVIVVGDEAMQPRVVLEELAKRGLSRVLLEGGPELAARFLDGGTVTDYCLTHSPLPGGADAPLVPAVPQEMRLAHRLEAQGFAMERWLA